MDAISILVTSTYAGSLILIVWAVCVLVWSFRGAR